MGEGSEFDVRGFDHLIQQVAVAGDIGVVYTANISAVVILGRLTRMPVCP